MKHIDKPYFNSTKAAQTHDQRCFSDMEKGRYQYKLIEYQRKVLIYDVVIR